MVNIKNTMLFLWCTKNNYPLRFLITKIKNKTIERKTRTCTEFLHVRAGVYVDENLNWKEHVNLIADKVSKSIGIITKARFYLSMPSLPTLYFAFFQVSLNRFFSMF